MSMRLIYGRSGTGKSELILNEIVNKSNQSLAQKIYIIVPEQFSYATEKRLLNALKEKATVNVEVISFKRLAYRIFLEVGGINQTVLSKTGQTMLIGYILEQNKKKLNFLGKSSDIDLSLRTITELKKHTITTDLLQEQIAKTENEYLKLKLNDINQIYLQYQNVLAENYIDEEDILTILGNKIKYSKMFDNSIVYIDEFSGFTNQEYIIIEEILKKAEKVNITICTDTLKKDAKPEEDVFYLNKKVVEKLLEHCKKAKSNMDEVVELKDNFRFKNKELEILEKNIYETKNQIYNKNNEHIHLKLCSNPYSEIEEIASTIIKLIKEKNIRFKDISILTKNIEDYRPIVSAVFPKYDIPVFIDNKKEVSENILVKYVLAIFEVFAKNFSSDAMWSYIKTGFLDIEKQQIYKLENYCKKWGIRGNRWYKEEWKYDSLSTDIEHLNELRKKIIEPLLNLKEKIDCQKTVNKISKNLYEFLEENNIKQKLKDKTDKIQGIEKQKYKNEYIASWNILMDVLDEMNLIFGNKKMTFEEYRKVLKSGLETTSIGEIPQFIDQVIIGDVERSRNHRVDTLFVLGLNDGIFPSTNFTEGFFNDSDRDYLKNQGIELAKGTIENIYDDRFNIYKALSTAENDIYLSYISSDKEGKAKRPSTLLNKIKKIFPNLKEESNVVKGQLSIDMPKATFGKLLSNIRNYKNGEEIDDIWRNVYNWYIKREEWNIKLLKAIQAFDTKKHTTQISSNNIKRLYGSVLKTSVSRLEQYAKCPFSFHLKYGLKLKEKEDLKIKPIDTGSFMHDIIDTFFDTVKDIKTIKDEQIEIITNEIINDKLSLSKNYIFTSTPKFIVLTNRLKKVILQSIKYIVYQMQNSDFNILANEMEFKKVIDNVEIVGKIDRLDTLETNNGKYIRIIDYKSSNKNIDLNELITGTQLQLITYLDGVVSKEKAEPAGMLYFSLIDPIIKADKNKAAEEIKEELRKKFKMNGMILADINVIRKMDKSLDKGASANIPVYIDKEGNISNSRSNVITKEQFSNIQKTAQKIIKQISNEILSGNIEIKPVYYKKTKIDVCKYCEYKTICGFDSKSYKYTFVENKTKEEILKELEKN